MKQGRILCTKAGQNLRDHTVVGHKQKVPYDNQCNRTSNTGEIYQEFDESAAINYAKGTLIEEIRNNPNRGTAKIMAIYDHETKELKTRRERL